MHDADSHANMDPRALPDPPPRWREFLTDGTDLEVVHRLSDGDPFSMRVRVHGFISLHGFFINPEALFLRGISRLAYEAPSLDPDTSFHLWCDHVLETACHELLQEQLEEELRHVPSAVASDGDFYRSFADLMQIEPELGRYACMRINRLPRRGRQAFAAIGLAGMSIEEFAQIEGCSLAEGRDVFKSSIKTVLDALDDRRRGPSSQEGDSHVD